MSEYVYVVDKSNSRIVKRLASNLSYIRKVGSYGIGNDQFVRPTAVTNDGTYLYVVDEGNYRIVKRRMDNLSYVAQVGTSPNWRPNPPTLSMPLTTPSGRTELFVNPGFNYLPEYATWSAVRYFKDWNKCVVGHWYGDGWWTSPDPLPTSGTSGCVFYPNTYIRQLVTLIVGKKYEVILPGHTTKSDGMDPVSFNIDVGSTWIHPNSGKFLGNGTGRFAITPELAGQSNGTSITVWVTITYGKDEKTPPRTLRFASLTEIPSNYEPAVPEYRPADNNAVIVPQDITNDGTYMYISSDSGYIFKRRLDDLSHVDRFNADSQSNEPLETPSGRTELFTDPAFNWRLEYYFPTLRSWECPQVAGRWYGGGNPFYGGINPLPVNSTSGCAFYNGSYIWQIVSLIAGRTYEVHLPKHIKGHDSSNPNSFSIAFASSLDANTVYQGSADGLGVFTATVSGPTYVWITYSHSWGSPFRILKFASLTQMP